MEERCPICLCPLCLLSHKRQERRPPRSISRRVWHGFACARAPRACRTQTSTVSSAAGPPLSSAGPPHAPPIGPGNRYGECDRGEGIWRYVVHFPPVTVTSPPAVFGTTRWTRGYAGGGGKIKPGRVCQREASLDAFFEGWSGLVRSHWLERGDSFQMIARPCHP